MDIAKERAEQERLKGNEHMIKKEFSAALDSFTLALDLCKEASSYSNRAQAYFKLDQFDKCVDDASEALKLDPNFIIAYHRRAYALVKLKKYEAAISDFEHILSVQQNSEITKQIQQARVLWADSLKQEGNQLMKEDQFDGAVLKYTLAI